MLPPNKRKKENEIDRNSPLGGDLNIAAVLSTSVPLSSSLSLSVSSSSNPSLGHTISKYQPWFSCTISSTFCKSSATWALLSELVLSKAWYLQPHLSTSLCSTAPPSTINSSTPMSCGNWSAQVNKTIVCLHIPAPNALTRAQRPCQWCSVNGTPMGTTSSRAWGPGEHRSMIDCWFSAESVSSVVSSASSFHPGVSTINNRQVSMSTQCCWSVWESSGGFFSWLNMVFSVEVLPEPFKPNNRRRRIDREEPSVFMK